VIARELQNLNQLGQIRGAGILELDLGDRSLLGVAVQVLLAEMDSVALKVN
jgi:hypothetical protein